MKPILLPTKTKKRTCAENWTNKSNFGCDSSLFHFLHYLSSWLTWRILKGHKLERVFLTVSYSRSMEIHLAKKWISHSLKSPSNHLKTLLDIISSIPPFFIFMNNEKFYGIEG